MKRVRAAAVALVGATLLGGCVVAGKGGPPPHAPAYGLRAKTPPKITVRPTVVVIAGLPVSYVANYPEDVFLFEGRWYRRYEGAWFWSLSVGGEWASISVGQVPRVVLEVPADYRSRKGGPPPHAPARGRRAKDKS
jgi:hypothetical protein